MKTGKLFAQIDTSVVASLACLILVAGFAQQAEGQDSNSHYVVRNNVACAPGAKSSFVWPPGSKDGAFDVAREDCLCAKSAEEAKQKARAWLAQVYSDGQRKTALSFPFNFPENGEWQQKIYCYNLSTLTKAQGGQ